MNDLYFLCSIRYLRATTCLHAIMHQPASIHLRERDCRSSLRRRVTALAPFHLSQGYPLIQLSYQISSIQILTDRSKTLQPKKVIMKPPIPLTCATYPFHLKLLNQNSRSQSLKLLQATRALKVTKTCRFRYSLAATGGPSVRSSELLSQGIKIKNYERSSNKLNTFLLTKSSLNFRP